MKYRRVFVPGATYFFTLVTYQRKPIFASSAAVDLLRQAFRYTMDRMPFAIVASVILLDHLHMIWSMPPESADYPTRWRLIKSYFTRNWKPTDAIYESVSRRQKGEGYVWQRRYWEHFIRDDDDFSRHIEYIHFNPVKHGLTDSPAKWEASSFMKFVENGYYPANWGDDGHVWQGEPRME